MEIDYSKLEISRIGQTVRTIEEKPHVRYIRYLLSKKTSPSATKRELWHLGLSSPHEKPLAKYFLAVMLPVIEKHGLTAYYKEYMELNNKKTAPNTYEPLNFAMEFGDKDDDRVNFCKFIRELEIEELWSKEVVRFYGGIHGVPTNEDGERIVRVGIGRPVDKVLTCPKRYLIDKLLLENIPFKRIANYMKENQKYTMHVDDIATYAKYFFNYKRKSMEEMLDQFNAELTGIKEELLILDTNDELTLGDKHVIRKQMEERKKFLEDTVRDLNSSYSEISYKQGVLEEKDLIGMLSDVVKRGHERFIKMDKFNDRDIVDPLTKVAKMMIYATEKISIMQAQRSPGGMSTDKHMAEAALINLVQNSYDTVMNEAEAAVAPNVDISQILGAKETGAEST